MVVIFNLVPVATGTNASSERSFSAFKRVGITFCSVKIGSNGYNILDPISSKMLVPCEHNILTSCAHSHGDGDGEWGMGNGGWGDGGMGGWGDGYRNK